MDQKLYILAVEAGPYVQLEKLKVKRTELELVPEPEKKTLYQQEIADFKASLEAELRQLITNIVAQSARNIQGNLSVDLLFEQAKDVYRKETGKLSTPFIMLTHIEQLREALQSEANSWDVSQWQNRLHDVDRDITSWKAKISEPFSPDKINIATVEKMIPGNKSLRWPVDRCKQVDGKWADNWLTDFLNSKPILFDSPQYTDRLMECYEKVYLVEAAKEQKEEQVRMAEQQKAAQQAEPSPGHTNVIPQSELQAMNENRESMDYGMRRLRELRRL